MAYFVRIRRKCASPKTTRWSTHSRRIDPISLSAKPFCQGEPGAMGLSRMPMVRNRCKRKKSAIIAVDVMRFGHAINTDEVFGTHRLHYKGMLHRHNILSLGTLSGSYLN